MPTINHKPEQPLLPGLKHKKAPDSVAGIQGLLIILQRLSRTNALIIAPKTSVH